MDYLLARRDEPCGRSAPEAILKAIAWVERVAEFEETLRATHGRLAWAAKDKITEILSEGARLIKRAPLSGLYADAAGGLGLRRGARYRIWACRTKAALWSWSSPRRCRYKGLEPEGPSLAR